MKVSVDGLAVSASLEYGTGTARTIFLIFESNRTF
jgi:hypothetical protein